MQHQKDVAHLFRYVKERIKSTEHFHVSDVCIGCGVCARLCPANAIQIQGGRPSWVKDRCYACLGCLRGCPVEAISYGMNESRKNPEQISESPQRS